MPRLRPGDDLHDRALKHLEEMFSVAKEQRQELEDIWEQFNDAFLAYERNARLDQAEQRSDVVYMIYHFIETVAAFVVDNMLPEEDFGSMKGRDHKEDKLAAEPINMLQKQRFDKARVREKLIKIVVRGLIYGISPAKVLWSRDMRTVNVPIEVTQEDGSIKQDFELKEFIGYEGPDLIPKSIYDVWWDRFMTSEDEGWVFDRDRMTLGEIAGMAEDGGWKNVKRLVKELRGDRAGEERITEEADEEDSLRTDLAEHHPGTGRSSFESQHLTGKDRYDMYEYWGPFDYAGDGNYITCVMNVSFEKKIVTRVEPQPLVHGQLPWVFCRPMPWLEEFMGVSLAGVNVGKQNYLNDILKLMFENWDRAVNQVVFRDSRVRINAKEVEFKAFRVYDVQTRQGLPISQTLHFPIVPDIKSSSFAIFDQILALAKSESSVEDFFSSGQTRGVTKTASGISQITERAGSRHKFKISIIEQQTIKRIGYQFFALDQQFANDEIVKAIIGSPLPRLAVESIIGLWDFYAIGSSTLLNKQADRENLTFLMQTLFQGAPIMAQTGFVVNFKQIWDGLAKKVDFPELADAVQLMPSANVSPEAQQVAEEEGLVSGGNGAEGLPPGGLGGIA